MPSIAEIIAKRNQANQLKFDDTIKDAVFSVWLTEQGLEIGTDDYNDLMSLPASEREQVIRSW